MSFFQIDMADLYTFFCQIQCSHSFGALFSLHEQVVHGDAFLDQENRDGSFDVIFQAVVKKHLTTKYCFNTLVINELCFLAWACIDKVAINHNALPR